MSVITLTTFDWVPELPRGYVRDLRIRWALEEMGLEYKIETVPFENRADEKYLNQPFSQVPWIVHNGTAVFETGAILLYLGELSSKLLPKPVDEKYAVVKWLFAALNSVEMASLPWSLFKFSGDNSETNIKAMFDNFLNGRLLHMDKYLFQRKSLSDSFSIADIAMTDVFRLIERFDGLANFPNCKKYLLASIEREAFKKALSDQFKHFGET